MNKEEHLENFEIDSTFYETHLSSKFKSRKPYIKPDKNKILAFIPGTILSIFVYEGKRIKEGDKLLILEAMKMENTVCAHRDGKIKMINVSEGESVSKNYLLLEIEN